MDDEGFNFTLLKHDAGILLISVDSLIGFFKRLENKGVETDGRDVIQILEHILEETGYKV